MTPREATWAEVDAGMYVRDKTEKPWRVEARRVNQYLLQDSSGQQVVVRHPGESVVVVLEPTDTEALAVVERALGGQVLSVEELGKPMTCPPLTRRLDVAHTHMFTMHGVWTKTGPGSKSIERLLEMHREDHLAEAPASHAYVRHEHH